VKCLLLITLALTAVAASGLYYFLGSCNSLEPTQATSPALAVATEDPESTEVTWSTEAPGSKETPWPPKPPASTEDPGSTGPFLPEGPSGRNWTLPWKVTHNRTGLEILILNALNDSWTPILTDYVEEWDTGYEDVDPLTLTVQRVEPDFNCHPFPGSVKICNGDYGETNWRGINTALLQHGYVVYSVIKLNDYWLPSDRDLDRRYTMCHELGHGIGLAHTDE